MIHRKQYFRIVLAGGVFAMLGTLYDSPLVAQDESVDWHSFDDAITLAEEAQKPVLVDVWAPWCGWCKKMQKDIYPNLPENLSKRFVWTRLNRDDHETILQFKNQNLTPLGLAQKLNTQSVPAIVFLSPESDYLFHTSGFIEAETLEPLMQYIASNAYQRESFESFLVSYRNR